MTVELMGVEIDNYTFDSGVNKAMELIKNTNNVSQIITINPEMFKQAETDETFRQIIDSADMVIPDGIGIKLALLLKGQKVNRIAGIDFARELLNQCAECGIDVAIIGSKRDVIEKAVKNISKDIPALNIVYYHDGYFDRDDVIYEELKKSNAKLVLVALGSPKQEYFIFNAKSILQHCLMIGIGGSLDVWSGSVKRAPIIYQKLGLEWLYRTLCQPERFKRIFPTLPLFLIKALTYKKG